MGDFRVELDAVEAFFIVGHAGDGAAAGGGGRHETRRHLADTVTVAHPHVQVFLALLFVIDDAVQQAVLFRLGDPGVAEFVLFTGNHLAAQLLGHGLHAVADTQHRNAGLEYRIGGTGRFGGGDRLRATGKNDALGRKLADFLGGHVEGTDFTVHADFPHPAGDQLGVLGTEVQNQDALGMDILHGSLSAGAWLAGCKYKGRLRRP